MADQEYTVMRPHIGDIEYLEGSTRTARLSDVAHLVASGCLIEKKVEPVHLNKAVRPKAEKPAK